jgi:Fe-S cluster biogenesis protein NfuA
MADDKTAASVKGTAAEEHATGGATALQFEDRLRAVLEKVRPFLQMDGGDIELVAIEDKNALVRLKGACSGCPSAIYTLKMGVEQAIRRELPDFGELLQVE